MYAIEFKTRIKDGMIKIPKEYRDTLQENVKVIILKEDEATKTNMIDRLFDSPLKIKKFKPFLREAIYEEH